jgi:hypothetical protein
MKDTLIAVDLAKAVFEIPVSHRPGKAGLRFAGSPPLRSASLTLGRHFAQAASWWGAWGAGAPRLIAAPEFTSGAEKRRVQGPGGREPPA